MVGKFLNKIRQMFCGKSHLTDNELREIIKEKKLNHIAIISDGNRRWARAKGVSPLDGHRIGFIDVAPRICEQLWDWGIHTVTLWCFSTGNMKREKAEVDNLMQTFEKMIQKMIPIAERLQIKIFHMGRKDRLPTSLQEQIMIAETRTKKFSSGCLNLAIDYSGPDEACRIYKKLMQENIKPEIVTEDFIIKYSDIGNQLHASPDLLIRPSGALRISGFMPFQSIYTELYFTSKYFPDFDKNTLKTAIEAYSKRNRTFSK